MIIYAVVSIQYHCGTFTTENIRLLYISREDAIKACDYNNSYNVDTVWEVMELIVQEESGL